MAFIPEKIGKFALMHPEFSRKSAALVICGMIPLENNVKRKKYQI